MLTSVFFKYLGLFSFLALKLILLRHEINCFQEKSYYMFLCWFLGENKICEQFIFSKINYCIIKLLLFIALFSKFVCARLLSLFLMSYHTPNIGLSSSNRGSLLMQMYLFGLWLIQQVLKIVCILGSVWMPNYMCVRFIKCSK